MTPVPGHADADGRGVAARNSARDGMNGLIRGAGAGAEPAGGAGVAGRRPRVVIADPLPREELEPLYDTCEVVDASGVSPETLREEFLPGADALIVRPSLIHI